MKLGLPLGGASILGLNALGGDTPQGLNTNQFSPFQLDTDFLDETKYTGGSAVQSDMEKGNAATDSMNRLARISGYTDWLETETPEEEALRQFQGKMSDTMHGRAADIAGRIDLDRDRGEGIASLAGAAAKSIMGGGPASMVNEIEKQRLLGKDQRTYNEKMKDASYAMADRGYGFEALPLEAARGRSRSRNITMPMEEKVLSDLQQQVANIGIAQIQTGSAERIALTQAMNNMAVQKMALQQANELNPSDFSSWMDMARNVAQYMPDEAQHDQYLQRKAYEFQAIMEGKQRMTAAAQQQFLAQ